MIASTRECYSQEDLEILTNDQVLENAKGKLKHSKFLCLFTQNIQSEVSELPTQSQEIKLKDDEIEIYEEPMAFIKESYFVRQHKCGAFIKESYFVRQHKCRQCDETFSNRMALKKHLRIHTGAELYQCSHCDKVFLYSSYLKAHLRTHTGEKPYQYSQCDKDFSENINLKKHITIHIGDKPYKCGQCNKAFSRGANLKCHLRTHTEEKLYQCRICDKAFSSIGDRTHHLMTHTGEKPYKPKSPNDNSNVEYDLLESCLKESGINSIEVHRNDNKSGNRVVGDMAKEAEDLDVSFDLKQSVSNVIQNKNKLNSQMSNSPSGDLEDQKYNEERSVQNVENNVHAKTLKFKCGMCDFVTHRRSSMKVHIQSHKNAQQAAIACPICGATYKAKKYLRAHLLTHAETKDFVCDKCDKKFTMRNRLLAHQLQVHESKDFVCGVCSKKFPTIHYLKCHVRIHTGESPYRCCFCAFSFNVQGTLIRHIRKMHDKMNFSYKDYLREIGEQKPTPKVDEVNLARLKNAGKDVAQKLIPALQTSAGQPITLQGLKEKENIKCSECDKEFSKKKIIDCHLMKAHRKIHTREKTHQCSQCDKVFTTTDKVFTTAGGLQVHFKLQ